MDAMAQLPLPAGLGAGTFPAKLWSLANDPRVLSVRWDSEARGLLVDRSLFERELLRPGGAQGPAPNAFRATQFRSFVRQLYRYGFRKVPGRAGAAAPGDAGAWVHYTNPWFRRDRPDLLLRIRRRSAANTQRRAAGPEGRRRPPCGSQQLPGPRPLPDERHGRARFQPLPRERPPLARRPPCGFHLLHRERPGPARREGPSRFQELYGERPLPAERELLRVPPCHFQGFHGEQLLPPRWEGPRSRMQELYGEQPPPLDRELLWMQPCSFQQLHREQQPPASNPPAAAGTSAPHAPAGSAGCAASTASSSAQNAPAQEESPALDLGQAIEKMIREIRNSLPVKAPSAQGNINVAPESPREDPMNRAAAEEVSSGTESCGNSSPEPEEPGSHLLGRDLQVKLGIGVIPEDGKMTAKVLKLGQEDEEKINKEVWAGEGNRGGLNIDPISVTIEREDCPIRVRQYPISLEGREGLKPVIEGLIKNRTLEPCMSPHNTPILRVKKPDGSYRLVQDLREVNKRTRSRYPVVPNSYTLLSKVSPQHQWFSVVDLKDAFWACPLAKESRDIFAFEWEDPKTGRKQQLRWTKLPQGFTESPNLFRQALEKILQAFPTPPRIQIIQYVDDLPLSGEDEVEVTEATIKLLHFLGEKGLKIEEYTQAVKFLYEKLTEEDNIKWTKEDNDKLEKLK
ncbi:hypothetical protein DUI87_27548 [Hirundo rustica rustica]|uniref:ribonuclease H n=1 Tax=Hirundo rustica rustica TaxID=333673 RepID=A0A3M0JAP5_HIRRU|nr:hypothetical protein DUI87_27548 [Hirundo rustica rustica]